MREFIYPLLIFTALLIVLSLCSNQTKASRPDISKYTEVELIIAVDASGSISKKEYKLQRNGVITAFRSNEFKKYLRTNKYGISVLYMEWSGDGVHKYTSWHRIHDVKDTEMFLADLSELSRPVQTSTAIYSAMVKSLELFSNNPYPGIRKVLDISGDGKNTIYGRLDNDSIIEAKNELITYGVTINGLPVVINTEDNDLEDYYRKYVIGGTNSFSLTASSYEEYSNIFLRKLLTELG